MIEYKIITLNNKALPILWKDNWKMCWITNEFMYFSREVKKSFKLTKVEQTKEYLNFKSLYPKKSGITDPKVINKVNSLVKENKYQELIDWVTRYNKFILVNNLISKFILNPLTFLNQERYLDKFDIIDQKVWASEMWMNDYLEKLDPKLIEKVLAKKKEWQKQHPTTEFTSWVLKNIITYFNENWIY